MKLIDTIKQLIYIAPVRCGRTFYSCTLSETDISVTATFTPTDEFVVTDPRRENEISMPTHINKFEEWQHTGMAVGSIEYFLKENNINYTITETDTSIQVTMSNADIESNLDKYETLRHAQRSFNVDTPVDAETVEIISSMIDEFANKNNAYKIMVTDPKVREVIYSLAIYWEGEGKPGNIHIPQMNAPLLITVPPREFDLIYYFRMGCLYSKIGLVALDRGYQLAFCNSFNYFDEKVKIIEDVLQLKYGDYTIENLIPRPFICIGNALDKNKPYNWVSEHDKIMLACTHLTEEFITVI
jgi:hypothetical protein